jgi:hypothetical protein
MAESQISTLSPASGSNICLQVARGFGKAGERQRKVQLLHKCFQSALLIQDDTERRRDTEMQIAQSLTAEDPKALDDLVGVADPEVVGLIEAVRIKKYVEQKKYEEALSRISNLSRAPNFPYFAAVQLMLALPQERDSDRRAVFAAAFENYRHGKNDDPQLEDFGTMIVRYWKHFPPEMVSDAIDSVLARDKEASKEKFSPSLTIATDKGELNFSSGYQYRLFQFLPILQEIDPGKAKSLLRENSGIESTLKKFPAGLHSLDAGLGDSTPDFQPNFSITYNLRASDDPSILENARLERETQELTRKASEDPKGSLKSVSMLPDLPTSNSGSSLKAIALLNVASASWRRDPEVAKQALSLLSKITADYPPFRRCDLLFRATAIYLRMGDAENASKTLAETRGIASHLYETDTNHDRRNLAFKLVWPSAAAWRGVAVLNSKLSLAETIHWISKLPDDEIRVSADVALANSILGVSSTYDSAESKFGNEEAVPMGLSIPNVSDLPTPR